MNAARALGNLGARDNVPTLINAMTDSPPRYCAWYVRLGLGTFGRQSRHNGFGSPKNKENGIVKVEIAQALTSLL